MNMTDDKAVPESFHGIAEDVSAYGLHDVLHELRTVGFDAFPFLCGSNTFVGDGFTAELILTDTRLHVGEKAGYGLAQWTYWNRKQALLEFAILSNTSIVDCRMQCEFLMKELKEKYGVVLNILKKTAY